MKVTVKVKLGKVRKDYVIHLTENERTTSDVEMKMAQKLLNDRLNLNAVTDWQITRIEGGELDD